MTTTTATPQSGFLVGIDAHQRTHHAVIIDMTGQRVADREIPVSEAGYRDLRDWAREHGPIRSWGVESTGSFAAGLTRFLLAAGEDVIEVNRPDTITRSREGKSDPIDAEAAARAVLSGRATARPKVTTGVVETIRMLLATRDSAIKARTAAYSQMRDLITTATGSLHDEMITMSTRQRVTRAARFRTDPSRIADPGHAIKHVLKGLARRILDLDLEITGTDKILDELVQGTVPTLVSHIQIGTLTAAQLLVTAGQNLDRFGSEAAFAKLTGTAPIPASSGKTRRMRLNRGGDRQANRALHLIAVGRLRSDPATRAYSNRRKTEGLSTKDILRCLKRAITREAYTALKTDLLTS